MSTVTPYIPGEYAPPRKSNRRARFKRQIPGLAVALVSLWLGLLWAAAIRPMNAPDEPAYLQAIMETRNKHMLPEIHFDFGTNPSGVLLDSPGDPLVRAYAVKYGIGDKIRLTPYQNSQPPLYFLIAGPIAMLLPYDPQAVMLVSRLISALFGAGAVYFSWAAVRQLAPRDPVWAVAVAAVITLLPEFCFNNSRVGNDSLVNCFGAAAFYVMFRGLRLPSYDRWMLRAGAVIGLALLSKLTAAALLPGLGLVVLFRMFQVDSGRLARLLRMTVGAGVALLAVCGWWLVRNLIAYGDPTGTANINRFYVATLQVPGFSLNDPAQRANFIEATWRSFWGYFGWQNILMPEAFYQQAGFFTTVLFAISGIVGLGLTLWRFVKGKGWVPAHVWQSALVMVAVGIALVVAFIQYSLMVAVQTQGRYLYLMLLPAALLFTGGLYGLVRQRAVRVVLLSIPIVWLAAMNFVGLSLVH